MRGWYGCVLMVLLFSGIGIANAAKPKPRSFKPSVSDQTAYQELANRAINVWETVVFPEVVARHGRQHAEKYNAAVLILTPVQQNGFPSVFMLSTWHFDSSGQVYLIRIHENYGWAVMRKSEDKPWQVHAADIRGESIVVNPVPAPASRFSALRQRFFPPQSNKMAVTIGPLFRVEGKDEP